MTDQTGQFEVWGRFPTRIAHCRLPVVVIRRVDSKELFYREGDRDVGGSSEPFSDSAIPHPRMLLTEVHRLGRLTRRGPDSRLLAIEPLPTYSTRFNVVLNWFEELRARVPGP
jgi:hypothetical protein